MEMFINLFQIAFLFAIIVALIMNVPMHKATVFKFLTMHFFFFFCVDQNVNVLNLQKSIPFAILSYVYSSP